MTGLSAQLKRSQFILGGVRTCRGLLADFRTIAGLAIRRKQIMRYFATHKVKCLQLAASNNILQGWLNTDLVPTHDSVLYLDATQRFPFPDESFDYILSEHMIEHISYADGQSMLRECVRLLKPGGRVRIATPDLQTVLSLHTQEKTDSQKRYIEWSIGRFMPDAQHSSDVFVINNFFRSWGHAFIYDKPALAYALRQSGFAKIEFYRPGVSDDPMLRNLERHGKEIGSEEINQFETIVAEGTK